VVVEEWMVVMMPEVAVADDGITVVNRKKQKHLGAPKDCKVHETAAVVERNVAEAGTVYHYEMNVDKPVFVVVLVDLAKVVV